MSVKKIDVPGFLKGLPRTTFVRRPAKTYEESTDPDVIYDVESLDDVFDKLDRRRKAGDGQKPEGGAT